MFEEGPKSLHVETEKREGFAETEEKLLQLGDDTDNKMEIVKKQQKTEGMYMPNFDVFKRNLEGEELGTLFSYTTKLNKFLSGPIITDSFDKDNWARRDWEREHLFDAKRETTDPKYKEVVDYYKGNKLAHNNFIQFQNFVLHFKSIFKDDVLEELLKISDEIGKVDKTYGKMEIEDKIRTVEEVSVLIKKGLSHVSDFVAHN